MVALFAASQVRSLPRGIPSAARAQSSQSLSSPCNKVKVQSTVLEKPKVGRRTIFDGEDLIGVSGVVQHTITYDGKPLANVQVHEDNTVQTTLNGQSQQAPLRENDVPTDANGQIGDLIGQLMSLGTDKENKETMQFYKINAFTLTSTNTLTFLIPNGATCSSTTTRTLTNGSGGSNYKITISQPVVASPAH
jgi:hypothetical protein